MILVFLVVSILIVLGGMLINECVDDGLGIGSVILGCFGFFVSLIITIVLVFDVSHLTVIDEKTTMYQKENAEIEEQIATVVDQYQKYETNIFTGVKPESSITLVSLYPELKSDTLVQKQLEVYVNNDQKIKELKEEKISGRVSRWWLYFGK